MDSLIRKQILQFASKLSSALLVKNKKDIKLQLVNFAKRTTGNIENYGVVLKDGKLMIDAILLKDVF